jgi:DNA-binding HxlR family transcriptional regulator
MAHPLEHGRLTIQEFEPMCPEVNRRTLQRDLKKLLEKEIHAESATSSSDPTKHYVLSEKL